MTSEAVSLCPTISILLAWGNVSLNSSVPLKPFLRIDLSIRRGRWMATDWDRTIRFWDAATNRR
jgi:hypothetical protein